MRTLLLSLLFSCIPFVIASNTVVYNQSLRAASNWEIQALHHLGVSEAALELHKTKRCIKLNNYWCLKDVGWLGGIAQDSDNHTVFKDGDHAARAAVRNFRTAYFKHRRRSSFDIMSAYAPPGDCVGSNAARRTDGTCKFGQNPTELYARRVAEGITDDIHEDLNLFDPNGVATDALVMFMANMSDFETGGLRVTESTIRRGICMEANLC